MSRNASRLPIRSAAALERGLSGAGALAKQRRDAQRRAGDLVTAVAALPASRRSAVILAKQRLLDPQYPSRDTLEFLAGLLAPALELSV